MYKTKLLLLAFIMFFMCSELCFSALAKKSAKKQVPKKGAAAQATGEADLVPKVKKPRYKSRSEIKYTGFNAKRNPFYPPAAVAEMLKKPDQIPGAELVAKDVKLPKVDLQGIIWSKRTPQVIVNDSVMKVGEFIEEFEIKEIRRTGIILFYKGNDYFIKMLGYIKKNKPKRKKR